MCKQRFTGMVRLQLAIALWAKHARAVESGGMRLLAASLCELALGSAGEHTGAAWLRRGVLDVRTRTLRSEHRSTLVCTSNAEAAALPRTVLAARARIAGADNEGTLATAGSLLGMLLDLGEYTEAETLDRYTLEKMRRVLGRGHREALTISTNLAVSLSGQGNHTEAVEIEREVLTQKTSLLDT